MKLRAVMIVLALVKFANAQPAQPNYCLELDGKSASGKIEEISGFQALNGITRYTFEAWVRPRTQGGGGRGRILDQESSSLTFYLSDEGRIGFRPNRDVAWQLSEVNSIKFWTWQHVAVTSDGKILRFFVDGKLLTAVPTNTILNITRKPLHIGNGIGEDDSLRGFDGSLDDLRVSDTCRWTKNFSPPIRGMFEPPDAHTILYMPFDEGPAYRLALDYSSYNSEIEIKSPLKRVKSPK